MKALIRLSICYKFNLGRKEEGRKNESIVVFCTYRYLNPRIGLFSYVINGLSRYTTVEIELWKLSTEESGERLIQNGLVKERSRFSIEQSGSTRGSEELRQRGEGLLVLDCFA